MEDSEYEEESDTFITVKVLEAYDIEENVEMPVDPTNRWIVEAGDWFTEHLNDRELCEANYITNLYVGLLEKLEETNAYIRALVWQSLKEESAN